MFNKIWAGLILVSLVFALYYDGRDLAADTYRNGQPLAVEIVPKVGMLNPVASKQDVLVRIDSVAVAQHYGTSVALDAEGYDGVLVRSEDGQLQLRFAKDASLPEPLKTIVAVTSPREKDLRGTVEWLPTSAATGDSAATASDELGLAYKAGEPAQLTFAPVRFVKLQAITKAAFDFAETAVTVALGLIGVLALWLGLLRIAETSGVLTSLVRYTGPIIRPLFPGIPKDHPALGLIILNMTANMLGLGNAATPLGIKAMEAMQTLNDNPEEATDDQVMFLAINTASVQLVPPVLLIAIIGLEVNKLIFPILIVTGLSLVVAIVAVKLFGKMRRFQREPVPPPAAVVESPGASA